MPLSMMKHLDEEVPPVFMILDTFDKDVKSLLPGEHLFCVYGDNWFQSVKYSLRCLVAVDQGQECVAKIKSSEEKLAEKKRHLENFQVQLRMFFFISNSKSIFFQGEFCELKKKYEEACKKLEEDINETVDLMQEREKSYAEYIQQSAQKYTHVPATKQQAAGGGGGGGILGGFGKLFG